MPLRLLYERRIEADTTFTEGAIRFTHQPATFTGVDDDESCLRCDTCCNLATRGRDCECGAQRLSPRYWLRPTSFSTSMCRPRIARWRKSPDSSARATGWSTRSCGQVSCRRAPGDAIAASRANLIVRSGSPHGFRFLDAMKPVRPFVLPVPRLPPSRHLRSRPGAEMFFDVSFREEAFSDTGIPRLA